MKYIKNKNEIKRIRHFMELAAREAEKSTCEKSHRGAIIEKGGEIVGRGYNKVTSEKMCNPCIRESISDNGRVEMCSAIHAEQLAIISALSTGVPLKGLCLYHIKVKNGEMRTSGMPSCTVCSRIIYEVGLEFVLWHEKGYAVYSPEELNELSFEYFVK